MSEAKKLVVAIGGVEVDVKSMSRAQVKELTRMRRKLKGDAENREVDDEVSAFEEKLLTDLYPVLSGKLDDIAQREIVVLLHITEQFSAGFPADVIEELLKNA